MQNKHTKTRRKRKSDADTLCPDGKMQVWRKASVRFPAGPFEATTYSTV